MGCIILDGKVIANVEEDLLPYRTIRHANCDVVLAPTCQQHRCQACSQYRSTLNVFYSRERSSSHDIARNDPSSKMNDRWRSHSELKEKISKMRKKNKSTLEQLKHARTTIKESIENVGIEVYTLMLLYTCIKSWIAEG